MKRNKPGIDEITTPDLKGLHPSLDETEWLRRMQEDEKYMEYMDYVLEMERAEEENQRQYEQENPES